ncbi:MAG: hypothetical protein V3R77_05430, partial [Candidatus Binatia bacterium]
LSAAGSALLYSTYLGGAVDDQGRGVATGADGVTYITGFSTSTGFPTANAFQAAAPGSIDAIVARIFDAVGTGCAVAADCDDGDPCNGAEACVANVCEAVAFTCDDGNSCTDDTCDVVTGCVFTNNTAGCEDGNACTDSDICSGGGCIAGTPRVCDDTNVCTDDTCDMESGCVFANNTGACDDNDACTDNDACSAGACAGATVAVCDDSNVCTNDTCTTTGGCVFTNNALGCDDGDACTDGDVCSAGACQPGPPRVCDDTNVCTDDSCDSGTGCVNASNVDSCEDGDDCTIDDLCVAGVCTSGTLLDCDDLNGCTDDVCDPVAGACVHTNNATACSDGDACTLNDVCSGGACSSGSPAICDDQNECTFDGCSFETGCFHEDLDTSCDDGDVCTTIDLCSGGFCVGLAPIDCDDSNACTSDSCDPVQGCVRSDSPGICDDGALCTLNDVCIGGVCVGAAVTCEATGADLPAGGGSVTTDGEGDGATIGDELETTVSMSVAGRVDIMETPVSMDGLAASIVVPDVTSTSPHLLTFLIEGTLGLSGSVLVSADGRVVRPCDGTSTAPCILSRTTLTDGELEIVANAWSGGGWRFAALAVCEMTPATGCRSGTRSNLLLADKADDTRDKARFRVRQGEAVAHAELGDPRADAVYGLCVYDTIAATPTLVDAFVLPAGSAAWLDRSPFGFLYSDPSGAVRGVQRLRLKAAPAGEAAVKFRANGPTVGFPVPADAASMFSQDPSVAVRVVGSNGICWTVDYAAAATRINGPTRYRAVLP